jgi:hypothetical protein
VQQQTKRLTVGICQCTGHYFLVCAGENLEEPADVDYVHNVHYATPTSPATPFVALEVSGPWELDTRETVAFKVDTGSCVTSLPATTIATLALLTVGRFQLRSATDHTTAVDQYAAIIHIDDTHVGVRAIGLSRSLLGMDFFTYGQKTLTIDNATVTIA